jgi:hypothetical protein
VPIADFAEANGELVNKATEHYFECCGKSICGGCAYSCIKFGNAENCSYCKADGSGKTSEEHVADLMKRVEANDAGAMHALGNYYRNGLLGLQRDPEKAIELWKQAVTLGSSQAHYRLGNSYREGGDSKKAQFHYEAAAMAGHEATRCNLGNMELDKSRNMKRAESYLMKERAVKHYKIAASAGHFTAMSNLLGAFKGGLLSKNDIEATFTAYNNSCAKMRSEARDNYMRNFKSRQGRA